jgi:hypothetical protein
MNVLSRLNFAKAQGRKRVVARLKTTLEAQYLTVASGDDAHIELDF